MNAITLCPECGAEADPVTGLITHAIGCTDTSTVSALGIGLTPPDEQAVRDFAALHDAANEPEPGDETGESDDAPVRRGIVDGKDAILDGRTGGALQQPMIEPTDSDDAVLAHLANCVEREARLRTAANKAKNALSKAQKETQAAQQHAAEWYSRSRQLDLELTSGGTEPEE